MPGMKKAISFLVTNFLYLSAIFNFRSNGEIINHSCNITGKEFLPVAQQNAGFSCPGITRPCLGNSKYYSIDGSCNNLLHPRWGSAGSPYVRIVAASYSDGFSKFRKARDGQPLPNSREISTSIFTPKNVVSNTYNMLFYGFAQWIDHDVSLSIPQVSPISCCNGVKPKANTPSGLCLPVLPPENDRYFSKFQVTCLDMKRSVNTATLGCPIKPIEGINLQTSWLDLSLVYGPSVLLTNALRTFRGGQLRVAAVKQANGQTFPPIIPIGCPVGGLQPIPGGSCMATGDPRLLQNPELTINEVMLFRMHNHIAAGLQKANPEWNDSELFNEARKLLIAKYQHVIYAEVIPALIGPAMAKANGLLPLTSGYAEGYNPEINGQVLAEFSAAAGRIMHSLVRGSTIYKDASGYTKTYNLKDKYFNQQFLLQGNTFTNLIQSFGNSQCGAQDQYMADDITDHLFVSSSRAFGQDLSAIDINRGRDFGIAPFNVFRKACGLCPIKDFNELATIIMNPTTNIPILEKFYKTVEDIDFYVAGILEKPVAGGLVGPTMACVFVETYLRSKFGDRFFYEFKSSGFTEPQLQDIRKTKYGQFVCLTNNITSTPANSLMIPSPINPQTPCGFFGDVNFNLFKEIHT